MATKKKAPYARAQAHVIDSSKLHAGHFPQVRASGSQSLEEWFAMKFTEDAGEIRPESRDYYEHHARHFISRHFPATKIRGKRILDVGCGPGFYVAMLALRGARMVGVDQSAFLIDKARKLIGRFGLRDVALIQQEFVSASSDLESHSFDYVIAVDTVVTIDNGQNSHCHSRAVDVFRCVSRLLRSDGRFFVIESHPCLGHSISELQVGNRTYYVHTGHYKFRHKPPSDDHHFFTLAEMTQAGAEAGLAIAKIHEPEPSPALKRDNARGYDFRLRFPAMIVYEFIPITVPPPWGTIAHPID